MAASKVPGSLKPIQPFLVISKQFAKRDPVVSYFAHMYAVQEGIKLGKGDPEAKGYLLHAMDQLQQVKQAIADEDALSSDVVALAHIEEVALKLFDHADTADRAAKFDRNMIKAYFTSAQLFTILKQFGELSEGIEEKTKYAKWKAVEIDRCLKNGITPTPGPPGGLEDEELGSEQGAFGGIGFNVQPPPPASDSSYPPPRPPPSDFSYPPPGGQQPPPYTTPAGPSSDDFYEKPVPKPRQNVEPGPSYAPSQPPPPVLTTPASDLGPAEVAKAQKLCKFAGSALEYEDIPGAVGYLEKALRLLKTGQK